MAISVALEERTTGIEAEYHLRILVDGHETERFLGKALKDTTFEDIMRNPNDAHNERRSMAADFSAGYQPPMPTLLQYFSLTPLQNVVNTGKQEANIHPADEIRIFEKLLDALAETDPSIVDAAQQRRLTCLGTHTVDDAVMERLRKVYQRVYSKRQSC